MADQTRDADKEQQKKNSAEQLDEKELDQVSGGIGGPDFIKIDLGPRGGESGPHGSVASFRHSGESFFTLLTSLPTARSDIGPS